MGDLTPAMESYIIWKQKKGTALTIYGYEKSGLNFVYSAELSNKLMNYL